MTNPEAIIQLTSMSGQRQNEIEAINTAIALLDGGFISDSAVIAELRSRVTLLTQILVDNNIEVPE